MVLPTNDEDLVNFILYAFDQTAEYLSDYHQRWRAYYKLYRSYVNEEEYPFLNKIFLPLVWSSLETTHPRIVSNLLFKNPLFQVLRGHPSTSPVGVRKASKLLTKWIGLDPITWHQLVMMKKEDLLVGTSAAKMVWSKKTRQVPQYERLRNNGMTTGFYERSAPKILTVENRPRLIHRDMYDIVPDLQHGTDPEFVIDVSVVPLDQLKYGDIEYENLDKLEADGDWKGDPYGTTESDWRAARLSSVEMDHPDHTYDLNQPRLLQEAVVREQTKDGEKIWVITVGNRRHLMRKALLPVWPWYFSRNYEAPHEFLGISEIESIEKLQHGYNAQFNMMMDNMLMAMTKMWLLGDGAEYDMEQFALTPFGTIQVSDINQVREVQFKDMPSGAFKIGETFVQAVNYATGNNDYNRGATPPRKEFVSTVQSLQAASEARIDAKIKISDRVFLVPLAKGMLEMAQNHLDEPEYVYMKKEDDFEEIYREDIQGLMDIRISTSSSGMSEQTRQQLMEFSQQTATLLGPTTPLPARVAILEAIAKSFNNEDIEEAMEVVKQLTQNVQGPAGPPQGPQAGPPGVPQQGPGPGQGAGLAGLAQALTAAQGGPPQGVAGPGPPQPPGPPGPVL